MDGFLKGHRVLIPSHVMALDKFERRLWMAERGIVPAIGGGTSFTGVETLAWVSASGGVVGPTASLLSIFGTAREALEPIAPSFLNQIGKRLWFRAYGTISTTATVPTYQIQLVVGPTIANPLTSGQMLAQNATITPAASTTGNLEYWLDVNLSVRATGSSGTILAVGTLINDWAAAGTYVVTPFKNATPPTAVTLTGAGGLLVPLFFDAEIIMGAATAGNSITCLDYQLQSLN
jgi:hypothetical protein